MKNQQEANQNSQLSRTQMEATIVAKVWQDEEFRQELLSNPKAVLASEFDKKFPECTNIQVIEESNDTYYLVIPNKPELEKVLSEDQLEAIAGGWDVGDWADHAGMPDSITVGPVTVRDTGPK